MLSLQNRIREILLSDPWFQEPVKVFIEDRAGMKFLFDAAAAKVANPVIVIQTVEGVGDNRPMGTCLLNESISLLFSQRPNEDPSGRILLEGVETAIHILHEAVLFPNQDDPGQSRIIVAGHGAVDGPKGTHMHEIDLQVPAQIRPRTPRDGALNF